MIGEKVYLSKKESKWILEHPDYFVKLGTGEVDEEFDAAMYLAILNLIGGKPAGIVTNQGANKDIFGVEFRTPFGYEFSYYNRRSLRRVRGA